MASKLDIDMLTDSMVRKKLGLSNIGERQIDILPTEMLERHYGKYSESAKAFRTRDIPRPFFRDIAKFLLEAGYILPTYDGTNVDWGIITGSTFREGLHAVQRGQNLRTIIQ